MSFLKIKKMWDQISSSQVTSESTYVNRRQLLKNLGCAGLGLPLLTGCAEGTGGSSSALAGPSDSTGPYGQVPQFWVKQWVDLFPAVRNIRFRTERDVTAERLTTGYNNFYEFSPRKEHVSRLVSIFQTRPWQIEVTGLVKKPQTFDIDDLV